MALPKSRDILCFRVSSLCSARVKAHVHSTSVSSDLYGTMSRERVHLTSSCSVRGISASRGVHRSESQSRCPSVQRRGPRSCNNSRGAPGPRIESIAPSPAVSHAAPLPAGERILPLLQRWQSSTPLQLHLRQWSQRSSRRLHRSFGYPQKCVCS